jgi:hypothetical protein
MVGELAQRHALSEEMIDGVNERSGGVPLFVEEVTRLLLERGGEGRAQAIPPTLRQSLAARLDRLGEAREIAEIGAVVGRDFSYALLRAVAGAASASVVDPGSPTVKGTVNDRGYRAGTEGGYSGIRDPSYSRRSNASSTPIFSSSTARHRMRAIASSTR